MITTVNFRILAVNDFPEKSHFENACFFHKIQEIIKVELVKINELTLVMIFVIFSQK